ncbi:MAG: GNAT family N-acetyltransferase [Rhodosalinus sp.]
MTLVPVIETERLRLRGFRAEDLDAFAAFFASERSRFVGGPRDRRESWRGMTAIMGQWALLGYGLWAVEERASGALAGAVGIVNHVGWEEPELGYHLYNGFEGRGLAFEAALAARTHAARHFGLDRLISYIDPANARSLALARRLGAVHERDGELLGKPCQVWRHPAVAEAVPA